ncbi:MAG: Asp-tRNA(Asn)/Glu-tRNA(Gln) amidotransferase subunit GatA [Verrucomicrobiota bacterium]|nr:Asp-tRNA(Asn)/Glu-tRNA(Gln) amidotransferase subunit GatA [Verrucomicrobiota bacterium]MDP6251393.1 Asp-tRNA(Asn)/Glu-tRNA(Gln) amidotransferase subunit GatA [Verrucomicrobiota bacterium]MDP7177685.1 Asp-tRNA(Asn)/Glu-tRNA(Gln) amidotransferase subunit GatA [Verrucomicrobiota bacterium]MDP7292555.1 Asp-tRNA(Asn)/Glu-tRNA(Gln) amidotransferase subunit GatA [Verrucomicrobiota bacterium]MDP7441506.1 Asp-tRNA(Asn)/Glu-tRNA(Gln) amidotransferase subunit GatA [Verrucomicrobiota bacterium]
MMLHELTLCGLAAKLDAREVSAREAMQACLDRIDAVDGRVSAFMSVDRDDALGQADAADAALAKGATHAGQPLLGVPVSMKDLFCIRGQPANCSSKILGDFRSPYDGTVVRKLRDAGAVLFGRVNMDEFAMGSSTENSAFGRTHNPWDLERVPGGSSGGSAAAVVAQECFGSIGTDTGGSIRQPAALCGCVGLKPTYGRVSRYGVVAFASSLDQVGPLARDVRDSAVLLGAMAGHDPRDSTSVPTEVPDYVAGLGGDLKGIRLGLPREYLIDGIDPGVRAAFDEAVKQCEALGAEIHEVSMPHTEYGVATYYIVATAEASANLARFDGIRYGDRVDGDDPFSLYCNTRGRGFGEEVKRRIILGTYVLSSGYYDAYYLRAQKVRTLIKRDFEQAFESVDALITPTVPAPAFKAGEKMDDPLQMYLSDIFTISCNLAGTCGISLPCGFTGDPKLPIGLQILGKPFEESRLLQIAHAYEQATPWHRERAVL